MKNIFSMLLILAAWATYAQTQVTEKVSVNKETELLLDFDFADEIEIKTWDKPEVNVQVSVSINGGEDDDIFGLISEKWGSTIRIKLNKDLWENANSGHCRSELNYIVYMPADMKLEAKTISGNFLLSTLNAVSKLKTISGDIDLTVPDGLDFKAKTISGEVYSDLDISFPGGKEGLHQIVGMKVEGRVKRGSGLMELETISGNIYLRKG